MKSFFDVRVEKTLMGLLNCAQSCIEIDAWDVGHLVK